MRLRLFGVACVCASLVACHPAHKATTGGEACPALVKNQALFLEAGTTVTISNPSINDHCLYLEATTKACGTASVQLVWDGKSLRSSPPQVNLRLHIPPDDSCEAQQQHFAFDLRPLREANPGKIIKLRLNGLDQRLAYTATNP